MQQISILPGRARFRDARLKNNETANQINAIMYGINGIKQCTVNAITGTILVEFDPNKISLNAIVDKIGDFISYPNHHTALIHEHNYKLNELNKYAKMAKRNTIFYGALFLLFKLKSYTIGPLPLGRNMRLFLLASAISMLEAYPLLKKHSGNLRNKFPTLYDLLFNIIAWTLIFLREDANGCLIMSLKWFNDYIKLQTQSNLHKALHEGMAASLHTCWLYTSAGQEVLIPLKDLQVEDCILIHQGDIVPADGIILEGEGRINNVYTTGRPYWDTIKQGDKVLEGMHLIAGSLKVKILRLPFATDKEDIDLEELNLFKKVDSYNQKAGQAALLLSAIQYIRTGTLAGVLPIALLLCPAAPEVAFHIGMKSYFKGLGKRNIYLKNVNVMEKAAGITQVCFDKTGTLTYGALQITDIKAFNNHYSANQLLHICQVCELGHQHPIANSLRSVQWEQISAESIEQSILIPTKGIAAVYENKQILIGNIDLMMEYNVLIDSVFDEYKKYEGKNQTPLLIAICGVIEGMIILQDRIRNEARGLVSSLKTKGLNVSLLTGNTKNKAKFTAQELGISEVYEQCTATDKQEIIKQKTREGFTMMVGDGINDLLAMKEADVSLCYANSCCDHSKLHADCIVFDDDLNAVDEFIDLSKKAEASIHRNVTNAWLFNLGFAGLAAFRTIDPFKAKYLSTINTLLTILISSRAPRLDAEKNKDKPI